MRTVDEIKEATSKLAPDEQFELFQWWVHSETFKHRQLTALKRDLAAGLDDLNNGRYQTYDDSNVMQLAEEVARSGQAKLKGHAKQPPK